MKRLLFIALLFVAFDSFSQPLNYTRIANRYRWVSGMFDSALYVPRYNGTPSGVRVGENSAIDGAIAIDTANSRAYMYSGGAWVRLANYSEVGGTYTAGDGLLLTASDFKVLTKRSITIDSDSLMLVNDSTASPSLYSYRINAAGRKGWYPDNTLIGVNIYNLDGTIDGNRTVGTSDKTFTISSGSSYDQLGLGETTPYWQQFITKNSRYVQLDASTDGANVSEFLISSRGPTSSNISTYSFDQDGFFGQMSAPGGVYSSFQFDPDSLFMQPWLGQLNIDSLRTWTAVGDTTYKKPMTWDTRNGRWEYASNWFGGGSGSTAISGLTAATATNTINNAAYQQEWQWNTLGSGVGLLLSSSSTAAASNTQNLFSAQLSGANGTSTQTTFAGSFGNAHTGTASTNVAVYGYATAGTTNVAGRFLADGGTNNYAIIVPSTKGSVGIGTETPTSLLHVAGTTKLVDGTEGQGKILTSDASGNATWKYDTTTLVTFNAGANFAADTAAFTDSTIYGSFKLMGNDTFYVTGVSVVLYSNNAITDTLGIQITYNDTINVIGSHVFAATYAVNNGTTGQDADGDDFTGSNSVPIPPGNWVWLKSPTVVAGRKPYHMSVSIIGYKKRLN